MKYLVTAVCLVVVGAIVVGFFIVGSPFEARVAKIDEIRVQHLQYIQSMVIDYWINKHKLPTELADLNDATRGVLVPTDPVDNQPYQYSVKDNTHFTLCATFSRSTIMGATQPAPLRITYPRGAGIEESWRHKSGSFCFDRSIDPDFYKPPPKPIYD